MFIDNFIKLTNREKMAFIQSFYWLILVRVMLWVFPFTFVQKLVIKLASRRHANTKYIINIQRIRFMIRFSSKYIPMATCLVQAMAGHILFSKYGYHTSIKIGVITNNGEFEAHAWLEHGEKVVLGESEKNFKTILGID